MSDAKTMALSHRAADLLLAIVEAPGMAISATALEDYHAEAGAELMAAGALESDGFEPVTISQADHDDAMVSVVWDGDLGGYGYFSPAVGMVAVRDQAIARYKLRPSWFLGWLAEGVGMSVGTRPVELVAERFWDLGDVWLGERKSEKRRTAIYMARRLGEHGAVARIRGAVQSRGERPPGVILSSSPADVADDVMPVGMVPFVPIHRCVSPGATEFRLDTTVIRAAAHGVRGASPSSPVRADAEFRIVHVGDRVFKFRGDKQREVVRYLHEAWGRGEGPANTALMFSDLEFPETTRMRDLFKGHINWRDLIGIEGGSCWLRYDELLAGRVGTTE